MKTFGLTLLSLLPGLHAIALPQQQQGAAQSEPQSGLDPKMPGGKPMQCREDSVKYCPAAQTLCASTDPIDAQAVTSAIQKCEDDDDASDPGLEVQQLCHSSGISICQPAYDSCRPNSGATPEQIRDQLAACDHAYDQGGGFTVDDVCNSNAGTNCAQVVEWCKPENRQSHTAQQVQLAVFECNH